ncbi:hypothetical protein HK104_005642, partial [Borealophlyctis nickersoniae]
KKKSKVNAGGDSAEAVGGGGWGEVSGAAAAIVLGVAGAGANGPGKKKKSNVNASGNDGSGNGMDGAGASGNFTADAGGSLGNAGDGTTGQNGNSFGNNGPDVSGGDTTFSIIGDYFDGPSSTAGQSGPPGIGQGGVINSGAMAGPTGNNYVPNNAGSGFGGGGGGGNNFGGDDMNNFGGGGGNNFGGGSGNDFDGAGGTDPFGGAVNHAGAGFRTGGDGAGQNGVANGGGQGGNWLINGGGGFSGVNDVGTGLGNGDVASGNNGFANGSGQGGNWAVNGGDGFGKGGNGSGQNGLTNNWGNGGDWAGNGGVGDQCVTDQPWFNHHGFTDPRLNSGVGGDVAGGNPFGDGPFGDGPFGDLQNAPAHHGFGGDGFGAGPNGLPTTDTNIPFDSQGGDQATSTFNGGGGIGHRNGLGGDAPGHSPQIQAPNAVNGDVPGTGPTCPNPPPSASPMNGESSTVNNNSTFPTLSPNGDGAVLFCLPLPILRPLFVLLHKLNTHNLFLQIAAARSRSTYIPSWAVKKGVVVPYLSGTFTGSLIVTSHSSLTPKALRSLTKKLNANLTRHLTTGIATIATGCLLLLNFVACMTSPAHTTGIVRCEMHGPELAGVHTIVMGLTWCVAGAYMRPLTRKITIDLVGESMVGIKAVANAKNSTLKMRLLIWTHTAISIIVLVISAVIVCVFASETDQTFIRVTAIAMALSGITQMLAPRMFLFALLCGLVEGVGAVGMWVLCFKWFEGKKPFALVPS